MNTENLTAAQQATFKKLVKQGSMGASHIQRATLDALVGAGLVRVVNKRVVPAEAEAETLAAAVPMVLPPTRGGSPATQKIRSLIREQQDAGRRLARAMQRAA